MKCIRDCLKPASVRLDGSTPMPAKKILVNCKLHSTTDAHNFVRLRST